MENNSIFFEVNIRRYEDSRGILTTIENKDIPFRIRRVYYLSELKKDKDRAHHANKYSKRVISVIQGSCKVILSNGKIKHTYELKDPQKGIFFDKKIWCELTEFAENTIVLALADKPYSENDYIRDYEEFLKIMRK